LLCAALPALCTYIRVKSSAWTRFRICPPISCRTPCTALRRCGSGAMVAGSLAWAGGARPSASACWRDREPWLRQPDRWRTDRRGAAARLGSMLSLYRRMLGSGGATRISRRSLRWLPQRTTCSPLQGREVPLRHQPLEYVDRAAGRLLTHPRSVEVTGGLLRRMPLRGCTPNQTQPASHLQFRTQEENEDGMTAHRKLPVGKSQLSRQVQLSQKSKHQR